MSKIENNLMKIIQELKADRKELLKALECCFEVIIYGDEVEETRIKKAAYLAEQALFKIKRKIQKSNCPTCGEEVNSIFDHVDQNCEAE